MTTTQLHSQREDYGDDLALAASCLQGDGEAIERFHQQFRAPLLRVLRRTSTSQIDAEDVLQDVLVKLLVGKPPAPPSLQSYRGNGPLLAWLSVLTARAAVDALRRPAARGVAEILANSLEIPIASDASVDAAKRDFRYALEHTLAALEGEERQLLRMHVQGLAAHDIASALGIHRVSVARKLAALRTRLRDHVAAYAGGERGALAEHYSRLSISLDRLLA